MFAFTVTLQKHLLKGKEAKKGKKISAAGSEEEDGYLFADRTFPFPKARGTEIWVSFLLNLARNW